MRRFSARWIPRSLVKDFIHETLVLLIRELRPVETSLSGDFRDARLERINRAVQRGCPGDQPPNRLAASLRGKPVQSIDDLLLAYFDCGTSGSSRLHQTRTTTGTRSRSGTIDGFTRVASRADPARTPRGTRARSRAVEQRGVSHQERPEVIRPWHGRQVQKHDASARIDSDRERPRQLAREVRRVLTRRI